MNSYLSASQDFSALSIRDLLDARDMYHVHLMHKQNVVATALGRYRIRSKDPWPTESRPNAGGAGWPRKAAQEKAAKGPRTLENSEVRPYSWPCILVFVRRWAEPEQFQAGGTYAPHEIVPPTLYLPDGRIVPVCVVEAPRYLVSEQTPGGIVFPTNNIGGGYPIIARVQGREHIASIGCLLSDGHKTYALTNRHVCGEAGETLYSRLDGKLVPIGRSSRLQISRIRFQELYQDWPGKDVFVNMDAGLVEISNLDFWSAKIRQIGQMGPLADLSIHNLSLRLIGCPVRAYGAASGEMVGEIHGMFYRYKSVGGFEHVADFLIGQRTSRTTEYGVAHGAIPQFATHPGDSGTLWLMDAPAEAGQDQQPMPFAVQWGAHEFVGPDGNPATSFVLATCLSGVCNRLGVDPVRDWNLDQPDTWGAVGHYSIAARALTALSGNYSRLNQLISNNLTIISYDEQELESNAFKGLTLAEFVPLADVPDDVWKHGRQGHQRPHEGPNHFADMDQKRPGDGADLLSLCQDKDNITPEQWDEFYDSVSDPATGRPITYEHRGLLPFRVAQIFKAMVDFAKRRDFERFLCAAGVLAHYVGDACQPLHISYLHDGDPAAPRQGGGKGVHSAYEDLMVGAYRKQILDGLKSTPQVGDDELIKTCEEAAEVIVRLMQKTFDLLPPEEIVQTFTGYHGSGKSLMQAMWDALGDRTIKAMQGGTHVLALLWESAWAAAGAERKAGDADLKAIQPERAMEIIADRSFVPSCYINEIGLCSTDKPPVRIADHGKATAKMAGQGASHASGNGGRMKKAGAGEQSRSMGPSHGRKHHVSHAG